MILTNLSDLRFSLGSCVNFIGEGEVMDAQAKKKALFRSKLNAKKKETRIDSPLVR